ncbi:hypothetical protein ACP70R_019801 [Stipagrostis hirtigluma subsp. patula]
MRMHVAAAVCSVVGALGLITVTLGVAGEASTAHAFVRRVPDLFSGSYKCVYRTTPALGCGVVAALLALTAQIAGTAAACCFCCRRWELPTKAKHIAGIVLSVVSWVLVIIVFALFIVGAVLNTDREEQATADNKCYIAPGSELFAAATVLSIVATGLQIASFIVLQKTAAGSPPVEAGQESAAAATGQPVRPEPTQGAEHADNGSDEPPASVVLALPEPGAEHTNEV